MNADSVIQTIFSTFKNIRWRECDENQNYEWYYAEDCHYVIRNKITSAYWFIKAKSPNSAFEIVMKKINNER